MHYCIAVITKDFPTDKALQEVMEPYYEERYYNDESEDKKRPLFLWDCWCVGGRYSGILKLKIDHDDSDSVYRWGFFSKEPRAGRLFRNVLLEDCIKNKPNRFFVEEDAYPYLGSRDGYIRADGCRIRDVVDFEDTVVNHGFGFVDLDGTVYVRRYWDGEHWIDDDLYEEKVKAAVTSKNLSDCYATYIDIHE